MTIPPVSGGSSDINNIGESDVTGESENYEETTDTSSGELPATEEEKKEAILHQFALNILNDWKKFDDESKKRMKQAQQEQ